MIDVAGFGGSLVSRAYAASLLGSDRLLPEPAIAPRLRKWWRTVDARCGPASSTRVLADIAASSLAELLGFTLRRPQPLSDAAWSAVLEAPDFSAPLVLTPWGASLDAAWRASVRHSISSHARWCFLFNGTHLRVLDAGRTFARRHIEFDLAAAADSEGLARLLAKLASAETLRPTSLAGADSPLASIVAASDAHGQRVCAGLRDGVHQALERLLTALGEGGHARRAPPLEMVYEQALTAVYRILFLCFAEARGLVPAWHPVYRDAYTMESLRATAESAAVPRGLWETFQAISRLAHHGCDAGDLRVTAFNGRLFAPGRAPLLDCRPLPDADVREVVLALSTTAAPGGTRERVSYRDLGVEELGAVYEGLLDYEPAVAPCEGPACPGRRPAIVLARSPVSRRKATGTFYTPRAITRFLVRHALQDLVRDATPERILTLRVVDPAMGSGAFLVAACRFLARAYEAALIRDGECHEGDVSGADRAGFRRLVAQRCLFGVDVNPTAVHLARLSLWLTTLAAEKPLTFLDHHLLVGDSLVGASPSEVARQPPGRRPGRRTDARQLPLFDASQLTDAAAGVRAARQEMEQTLDDTAAIVRRKEQALAALATTGALQSWKAMADLWCSAWFGAAALPRGGFHALVDHVLTGRSALPEAAATRYLSDVRRVAATRRFFHWPLEFPEVFFGADGREHPDGGFDAVIGNPPWEMLRADAGVRPESEDADRSGVLRFTRDSGLYHAQSRGHANQYQLFVERALRLARPGGRVALVVPSGITHDHGCAPLRHLLLRQSRVESLVGFDNRTGVFPIHRSVRFLLLTVTRGGETTRVRCRFGLQDTAALDALGEATDESDGGGWFSLTPALLEQLSGPGLAIPDVRAPLDLAIIERAAREHPPLGSPAGWHVRFGRELNASDDRQHFTTARRGLPIIEGKHLTAFAVNTHAVTLRIAPGAAARLLDRPNTFGRPRLAFRDVASATNRTTLIAAVVPPGCVTTHTLFCLRTRLAMDDQLVLCALFNSYPANFLVRLRVSTHVSLAVMDTLPVPRPHAGTPVYAGLLRCAKVLAANPAHSPAAADMHALAARAYGLTHEEFAHVLSSFPRVPAEERQQALQSPMWTARRD